MVDHLDSDQVSALADRIRTDHGHIDVLVNDIWGGEELKEWDTPIWEHDLDNGLRMLRLAIDTHLITSHHLLPLVIDEPGGLLVEMTDGTNDYNATHYRLCVYYDLAKVAVNRLAFSQGHELESARRDGGRAHPGMAALRDDARHLPGDRGDLARGGASATPVEGGPPVAPPDFALSESPRYVGRAVAALAADPDRARWNQQSVTSGQLAQEYGFTDLDGSQPDDLALHGSHRPRRVPRPRRLPLTRWRLSMDRLSAGWSLARYSGRR